MFQVVIGQAPAPAVLEPLFAHLIAADAEIPHLGRYAFEVLPGDSALRIVLADIHTVRCERLTFAGLQLSGWAIFRETLLDKIRAGDGIAGNRLCELRGFEQV